MSRDFNTTYKQRPLASSLKKKWLLHEWIVLVFVSVALQFGATRVVSSDFYTTYKQRPLAAGFNFRFFGGAGGCLG